MKRVLPLLFFFLLPAHFFAQTNEGTDFWLGFMEHINVGQNSKILMVTAKEETSGKVSIPLLNWEGDFTVGANTVTLIGLPQSAETVGSEAITLTGIHVESDLPISVYAHQYHQLRSEAALILPTPSLGLDYFVMSYFGYSDSNDEYPSEFLAVAIEDETVLTITPSARTKGGKNPGQSFSVTLDAGESYQVQAVAGNSYDLTGSRVQGDKPFALFGGARWTQVPTTCVARDNLYEQMYPVETWGKRFILMKNQRVDYDLVRIMAAEDDTQIFRNNSFLTTLNRGDYTTFNLTSSSMYIEASKGILVAQYNVGSGCNGLANRTGDPSMLLVNSIEQTRDTLTIYSSGYEAISENYINLIARTDDIGSVTLDGNPVSGFETVAANDDFSVVGIAVGTGPHTLIGGGCGLVASATGYGEYESYAYSAGASFKNINVNPIPVGGCLDDTLFFDSGLPVGRALATWDFGDGTGSADLNPTHIYTELGSYRVRLVLTDLCLSTVDTIEQDLLITLRQQVEAAGDTLVCEGETVSLRSSDLAGANYEWRGPSGYFSTEQFPTISNILPAGSGEYKVVGIISGCATYPNAALVGVNPTPAPVLGNDTTLCPENGDMLMLFPGDFGNYRWQDGSGVSQYEVQGPGLYWVEVEDNLGCTGNDSLLAETYCPPRLFVPTAFSPNEDGFNDLFQFSASFMTRFEFQIFNRWGQKIFATDNPDLYWDGRLSQGGLAPEGVYVWTANFDYAGKDNFTYVRRQAGTVTLIR